MEKNQNINKSTTENHNHNHEDEIDDEKKMEIFFSLLRSFKEARDRRRRELQDEVMNGIRENRLWHVTTLSRGQEDEKVGGDCESRVRVEECLKVEKPDVVHVATTNSNKRKGSWKGKDHGREFDNKVQFGAFCDANHITHNFSAPRTPQSNGVVEHKNCTLQEMSRTMLNEQSIPQKFWCNAVDTSTYILNRILIRPFLGKTPYELFKGKKPSLEYFKVFGSKCFILNTKENLTKFDPKSTEGVFLGYSPNSKAYIILSKETMRIEESLNVRFDKSPPLKSSPLVDDDIIESEIIENQIEDIEIKENEPLNKEIDNIKESKDDPIDSVIGVFGKFDRHPSVMMGFLKNKDGIGPRSSARLGDFVISYLSP
ncbi:retrovirus-related pol polyprotein from transposon TNT 1-94 [Tanacetum coccineum]